MKYMMSYSAGERPCADEPTAARDADVVDGIVAGRLSDAFHTLMQRYEIKVYRLCVAFLRNPAEAQDAAQESLLRVWRALPTYDGRAALSTWIYAITRNWCLTQLSRRRTALSLNDTQIQLEVDSIAHPDASGQLDRHQALRQLVDELPEATRRIVVLYYFEEQAVAEVAVLMGLPEGTIKTHLFRARTRLLARLEVLKLADPSLWLILGDGDGR